MGLPGISPPCPAGHHSDIHGPTDNCCDRQQKGEQAEGERPMLTCPRLVDLGTMTNIN